VLIRISEDFFTKNTPPIPPPPAWPGTKEGKAASAGANNSKEADPTGSGERPAASIGQGWKAPEIKVEVPDGGFERNQTGTNVAPPTAVHPPEVDFSRQVDRGRDYAKTGIPGSINPQGGRRSIPRDNWAPGSEPQSTSVPFCIYANKQITDFALNDLEGRPYSYRQGGRRLVLLDFWATWCVPCRHTIPHLRILQERYRDAGLEVVGITYEGYGKLQEQRRKIYDVSQNSRINYKLLLGRPDCPVKAKLGIRIFPTLILLDQNGWIIWRHEGAPGPGDIQELESKIQSRLGAR
jgi:thiol-disulfide isomerase/thioredoxin